MPGTVVFKPLDVNLVQDKSLFGKTDSYCVVSLGEQKIQTKVVRKEKQHPKGSDFMALQVIDQPTCLVELKDPETLSSDDNLGVCQVSLDEIESQGSLRRWYSITHNDKSTGKILLEATFIPQNQDSTEASKSPQDNLISPDDELEEDLQWIDNSQNCKNISSGSYKYPEQPDDWLDEQLSPIEIEFPEEKHFQRKKFHFSFGQDKDQNKDNEIFLVDVKTEQPISREKSGPKLSVSYSRHPLESGDESPTKIEPLFQRGTSSVLRTQGSDTREDLQDFDSCTSQRGSLDSNSQIIDDDDFSSYQEIMGSHWDI